MNTAAVEITEYFFMTVYIRKVKELYATFLPDCCYN